MERLSDTVGSELARFGGRSGLAEVVDRWPAVVGEAIARNAWPARVARDGTLHVATTDSVWAFELGHRAAEIADRLGVTAVRFAAGPIPRDEPPRLPEVPQPTARDEAEAAAVTASIEDENLRESVQKAMLFSLARGSSDRPL